MRKPGLNPEEVRGIALTIAQDRADVPALMHRLNGYHSAPTCDLWIALCNKLDLLQVGLADSVDVDLSRCDAAHAPRLLDLNAPAENPELTKSILWLARRGVRRGNEPRRKPLPVADHKVVGAYLKNLRNRYVTLYVQLANAYPLTFRPLRHVQDVENAIERLRSKLEDQLCHDYPDLPRATHYYYGADGPESVRRP